MIPYDNVAEIISYEASLSKNENKQSGGGKHKTKAKPFGAKITNDDVDERFTSNSTFGKKVRKVNLGEKVKELAEATPAICIPVSPAGKDRCLQWHVKGKCREKCRRAYDHVLIEAEGEKEDLYNYVGHLVA